MDSSKNFSEQREKNHADDSLHEQPDTEIWRQFSEGWRALVYSEVEAKIALVAMRRQFGQQGVLSAIDTMKRRSVKGAPHKYLATICKGQQAKSAAIVRTRPTPEPEMAWVGLGEGDDGIDIAATPKPAAASKPRPDDGETWQAALSHLRGKVPPATFDILLAESRIAGWGAEALVFVALKNRYCADLARRTLTRSVRDAFAATMGSRVRVVFQASA